MLNSKRTAFFAAAALCCAGLYCGSLALAQTPPPKVTSDNGRPVSQGANGKSALFSYVPGATEPYIDEMAGRKKILIVGDTHTGNQNAHDSVSHALAVLQIALTQAGYAPFIKTDTQWLTTDEIWGKNDYAKGGLKQAKGRNLNDFAAVVFYTNGDTDMSTPQKAQFLAWLHSGHGFVGIHTTSTTMLNYPPYAQMLGSTFDNHPWYITTAKMIVEDRDFPGMLGFVLDPMVRDEFYQLTDPYSRKDADVLLRIDPKTVDVNSGNVHRTDNDFPMAYIKMYGTGRVFYSSFGHSLFLWDDPRIQNMYVQAVRWAAGDFDYPVHPHLIPAEK